MTTESELGYNNLQLFEELYTKMVEPGLLSKAKKSTRI